MGILKKVNNSNLQITNNKYCFSRESLLLFKAKLSFFPHITVFTRSIFEWYKCSKFEHMKNEQDQF